MDNHLHGQWYRGGTSKCWLFANDELPADRSELSAALISAFGSGDARQLNGVGGATSTTSKAAIVSPSAIPGIDISYLFAQIGIGDEKVEFTSNCGNCASAVALYAIQAGLVRATGDSTEVRMINENTRSVLRATVGTPGGTIPVNGTATIPGSSRPGVPVSVFFENADGATTGELLPSAAVVDTLVIPGGSIEATCIDAGAPACFIRASDLGMNGSESIAEVGLRASALIGIRSAASVRMGLTLEDEEPSPAIPKVGIVAEPVDYTTAAGQRIERSDYDIAVRMISMFAPHPAIGITSAVALVRAASVEGSLVKTILQGVESRSDNSRIRIGTPAGVITCHIEIGDGGAVELIGVQRVARRIANAEIDLPMVG